MRAVERLDLALLVDREDERALRRVEIEADHVHDLLDELLVVGQLEGLRQMRLQPVRRPDALHAGVAESYGLGELACRPMRPRRRLLVQRHRDHPRNHRCRQRLLATRPGRIAFQPGDAAGKVVVAPAVGGPLGLTQRPHNRRDPVSCRPHQDDPRAPDPLLGRVPVRHPTLQPRPINR